MKRADLERNFIKLVEYEVLRQLYEKLDHVTYDWLQGPLSDSPKIEVYIGQAGIELPVKIYAGQVYIIGLNDGYRPVNSYIESK